MKQAMVMEIFITFCLSFIAYALIYAGVYFLNQRLLPNTLSNVYAHVNLPWRTGLFLVLAALPGNLILAKCFDIAPASIVAPILVVSSVLVIVASAILIDGVRLNWHILGATVLAVFSCGLVSWTLMMSKS